MKSYKKILMVFLLPTFFSCNDEADKDVSIQETGDILSFKNSDEIFAYGKARRAGSFESFDDVFKKAILKLGEAKTIEDHARILEDYRDVLTLKEYVHPHHEQLSIQNNL